MRSAIKILVLAITSCAGTALPAQSTVLASDRLIDDPLLYAHLIVEGTITDISHAEVRLGEWGHRAEMQSRAQVTRLRLSLSKVLRGAYENDTIDVAGLNENFPEPEVGMRAIMCLYLNAGSGSDRYLLRRKDGLFRRLGGGWVRQSDDRLLIDQEVDNRIESTKLTRMVANADVIVVGKVASKSNEMIRRPDGTSGLLERVVVQVESTEKGGRGSGETLEFVMITVGTFAPEWRCRVPHEVNVGERWYLFLKRGEFGYYPVLGMNGMMRIDGGELVYEQVRGKRVLYPLKKERVDKFIEELAR